MSGKTSAESKNRYNAKAYDRIQVVVPKGRKDQIQEYVKQTGESLNGFINRLIDRELDNTAIPDSFGTETRSEENR